MKLKPTLTLKSISDPENPYGRVTPAPPETRYFLTREEFDTAVGADFIEHANSTLEKGGPFMVGLSHGQSPAGAYRYIFEHYGELKNPGNILYTFTNSPLPYQRNLEGVMDARRFIKKLYRSGLMQRTQLIGWNFNHESLETYAADVNKLVAGYLKEHDKEGFDYVFVASDPTGRVAGIDRNSAAFGSTDIAVIVTGNNEKVLTGTPYFLLRSKRIAFLATKADKRRPLAWLYAIDAKAHESPGFLRYVQRVHTRLTVFIDDKALNWPQITVHRETHYGTSAIRIDMANPYNETAGEKLPVILFIHGFLGLNTFDALLATIPSHKYIAAAMHYGTIPYNLPPVKYSQLITHNIDAVVKYFGAKGHPVYIYDHSVGNIYLMMIDRDLGKYPGIKKYLHGRIGANPFFGEECKHAIIGYLDNVLLPALSLAHEFAEKTMVFTLREVIPLDSKKGVRKRCIRFCSWLICNDNVIHQHIWSAVKERTLYLMNNMDSIPQLNHIPIEHALNKLPPKVFVLQMYSALKESIKLDAGQGIKMNFATHNIPVLILKSERDGVARFVPHIYEGKNTEVRDMTNHHEYNLFREHLYHMIHPHHTAEIIDGFIEKTENNRKD